jgi:hypothetical protein
LAPRLNGLLRTITRVAKLIEDGRDQADRLGLTRELARAIGSGAPDKPATALSLILSDGI